MAFNHRMLVPRSVVLDPEVTLETPEWLLFSTGVRALDHAVESYMCPLANPASESLSLGPHCWFKGCLALRPMPTTRCPYDSAVYVARHLAKHVRYLSWVSHGIGYAQAQAGVPHGHTSCVMLPAVMQWNAETLSELSGARIGYR